MLKTAFTLALVSALGAALPPVLAQQIPEYYPYNPPAQAARMQPIEPRSVPQYYPPPSTTYPQTQPAYYPPANQAIPNYYPPPNFVPSRQVQPQSAASQEAQRQAVNKMGRDLLQKGKEALDQGNVPLALQIFQEVARFKTLDPNPTFWMGVIYERNGNLSSALEMYAKAVKQCSNLGMDCAELRVNLGNVLSRQNYLKEAEYDYRRAIDIDDRNHAAHLNLARLLLFKGEYQAAFDELKRLNELSITDPMVPLYASLALKGLGKLDDARGQLDVFLSRAEGGSLDPKVVAMARQLKSDLSAPAVPDNKQAP